MKNFRKVLALVLVVATLFSFASVAGAKSLADYKDADKVSYDEAVEVLSALEILNGYTDGSFKPQGEITRAEMAKMIAVLSNAGDDVSDLYAAACDFADAKEHWAASYIAYCAQTGVVAGYSATAFGPEDKVTGLQTAKMLLVTMGFDADEQGYTGANWKVNVLRDAKNFGLLNGFAAGYNVDANITREEAANMMLNALCANVIVGVLSDNIVKITNALYDWFQGATLTDAEKYGFVRMYGNVIVASDCLAEALYGNRLDVVNNPDCYGRPGYSWTLVDKKGNKVLDGVRVLAPMVASDYKGEIVLADVIKAEGVTKYATTCYVNGYEVKDVAAAQAEIGKGVLVEVYVEEGGFVVDGEWVPAGEVTIVVIDTYISTIKDVNLKTGEITIEGKGGKDYTVKNTFGFTKADKGAVVLYYPCKGHTIHNVEKAPVTVATLTAADKTAGEITFVADGTTYEYANNFGMRLGGHYFGEEFKADDFGAKHSIYTDAYGYVMLTEAYNDDAFAYAVVKQDTWVSTNITNVGGTVSYKDNTADFIYFQDNTAAVTEKTTYTFNSWVEAAATEADDILVKYVVNADGTIDFDATETDGAYAGVWSTYGITLKPGSANVTGAYYKVDSDTQYIVRVKDYVNGGYEYKYFDSFKSVDAAYVADEFQYFLDADGRTYSYIFMTATYVAEANRAIVLSENSQALRWTANGGLIGGNKYNAIIDGEEVVVIYDERLEDEMTNLGKRPYVVISELVYIGMAIDGTPIWSQVSEDDEAALDFCTTCEILIDADVMTWKCTDCADHSRTSGTLDASCITDETVIYIVLPATSGYTCEKITAEQFDDYRSEWGYEQTFAYADFAGETCTQLILFCDIAVGGAK